MQLWVLSVFQPQPYDFPGVIPEIDIWRAATLMLKRYGEKALEQSRTRIDELAAEHLEGDVLIELRVARVVDAPHPPDADEADELVAPCDE